MYKLKKNMDLYYNSVNILNTNSINDDVVLEWRLDKQKLFYQIELKINLSDKNFLKSVFFQNLPFFKQQMLGTVLALDGEFYYQSDHINIIFQSIVF